MTDVSEQLKNKIYAMVENVRREMIDLQPVQFVFFNNNTCGIGLKKAFTFTALATFNCTVVNLSMFY